MWIHINSFFFQEGRRESAFSEFSEGRMTFYYPSCRTSVRGAQWLREYQPYFTDDGIQGERMSLTTATQDVTDAPKYPLWTTWPSPDFHCLSVQPSLCLAASSALFVVCLLPVSSCSELSHTPSKPVFSTLLIRKEREQSWSHSCLRHCSRPFKWSHLLLQTQ